MNDLAAGAQQFLQMLMGGAGQASRLLRLEFPKEDGPEGVTLVANQLSARESLGRDFEFRVQIMADSPDIELKDVIGRMVTVAQERQDGGEPRYYNGYVFDFAKIRDDAGYTYYEMLLLPWLAFLRYRQDNYLFHGMNVAKQTADIFEDYDMRDWETVNLGDDPDMTDAAQFSESDYNYLHRRWEALGWTYWYEHRRDGHTLKLCGDSTLVEPIDGASPEVSWHGRSGLVKTGMDTFSPVRGVAPTQFAATSFDFKNPRPLKVDVPTTNVQGTVPAMEVYEYTGAYGFKDQSAGDALVRLRMEELEARGKHFEGRGDDDRLMPGRWFRLTDPGSPLLRMGRGEPTEGDDEFLIVEVRHHASNNYQGMDGGRASYGNELICLRKRIPWRPGRGANSQEPRIYGLQSAIVVGPEGDEIHTDKYGRVRVQFHWDRIGEFNEKSSAWVRVASTWAGSNFGFMAVPRVGQEVLVQFLDGNPDRPLITGRVYNEQNMPPWTLPANKTQTGILSRSTTGGAYENANALRFEDKKGAEQVWLHAERNQDIEVEADETHWVGNDRKKTIDRDETVHVKRNRTETVDNDETITVHHDRTERVDSNERISIGQNRTEDVGVNESLSIGANRTKKVGQSERVNIGHNYTASIGRFSMDTVGMAKMTNIGMGYNRNVGLAMISVVGVMRSDFVGKTWSMTAGDKIELKVGSSTLTLTPDAIYLSAKDIHLTAENQVNADAKKNVQLNSGTAQPAPDFSGVAEPAAAGGGLGGIAALAGTLGQAFARVGEDNGNPGSEPAPPGGGAGATPAPAAAAAGGPMPAITAHGTADASDVALVRAEMNKMPAQYRQQLKDGGVEVKVVRNSITEYYTDLKGVKPRGWPPGTSWDSVPGVARGKEVIIATRGHATALGAQVPLAGNGHGSQNLVLHETAHAIQTLKGASPEFLAARTADLAALDPYQLQAGAAGVSETFAESFANVFGGNSNYPTTHPHLYDYWTGTIGK